MSDANEHKDGGQSQSSAHKAAPPPVPVPTPISTQAPPPVPVPVVYPVTTGYERVGQVLVKIEVGVSGPDVPYSHLTASNEDRPHTKASAMPQKVIIADVGDAKQQRTRIIGNEVEVSVDGGFPSSNLIKSKQVADAVEGALHRAAKNGLNEEEKTQLLKLSNTLAADAADGKFTSTEMHEICQLSASISPDHSAPGKGGKGR